MNEQEIADQYEEQFGNFGDIALPEFMTEPKFIELLQQALTRGTELTKEEVSKAFPDAAWEY